jgi:hypothetical protein
VGATASVPLRLYASGPEPQPFTASFPSDTPLVFQVRAGRAQGWAAEGCGGMCGHQSSQTGQLPQPTSSAAQPSLALPQPSSPRPASSQVQPARGLLAPAPRPGEPEPEAALSVSYSCREFGRVVRGHLHVATDDM